MTKRTGELVGAICGADDHPLAPALRRWCGESRPFLAFAEANAAKLRKKVRLAARQDERDDLLAELAVAALWLRDPRFRLLYEPLQASGQRGPDFRVTFRTRLDFHVEVTRLRLSGPPGEDGTQATHKLARVIADKLGQLPSGGANLLLVALPPGVAGDALMPAALRLLGGSPPPQVASTPPAWWPEALRAFAQRRQRLSAVVLCSLTPGGQAPGLTLWLNPQAKHALPPEVASFLTRTLC